MTTSEDHLWLLWSRDASKNQWQSASFWRFQQRVPSKVLGHATGNLSLLSEQQLVDLQILKNQEDGTHSTNAPYFSYSFKIKELVDLASPDNVCCDM